jgi:hypothetical protein
MRRTIQHLHLRQPHRADNMLWQALRRGRIVPRRLRQRALRMAHPPRADVPLRQHRECVCELDCAFREFQCLCIRRISPS